MNHRSRCSRSSSSQWRRGTRGEDETVFAGRGAGHSYNIGGITATSDGFEEEREWARGRWSALEPYHTSVYVNFLKALKHRYDPDNVFRLNQNIPSG